MIIIKQDKLFVFCKKREMQMIKHEITLLHILGWMNSLVSEVNYGHTLSHGNHELCII